MTNFTFEAFTPYLKKSLVEKIMKYDYRKLSEILRLPNLSEQEKGFLETLKSFSEAFAENKFIGQRYNATSQRDLLTYFELTAHNKKEESVYIVFLDAKNKIMDSIKATDGTITQSLLYPREVIKATIDRGALSIVIIHNHPSGDTKPSENDRKITRKLLFATKETDIVLLDHIIIGGQAQPYFSFYEEGLIERYNTTYRSIMETQEL